MASIAHSKSHADTVSPVLSVILFSLTICCCCLGDVEEIEIQQKPALKVFKSITVIQEPGMVVLEVGIGWGETTISFSRSCRIVSRRCCAQLNVLSSFLLDDEWNENKELPLAMLLC